MRKNIIKKLSVIICTTVLMLIFVGCYKSPAVTQNALVFLHNEMREDITGDNFLYFDGVVLTLARSGELTRAEKDAYLTAAKVFLDDNSTKITAEICNRMLLTLVAIEETQMIVDYNLATKLFNWQFASEQTGEREYSLATTIDSLISLESIRMHIPQTYTDDKGNVVQSTTYVKGLIDVILSEQQSSGLWQNSIYVSAKAIIALKNHIVDKRVFTAIEMAYAALSKNIDDSGAYKEVVEGKSKVDVYSSAMVIIAMCEMNFDVELANNGFIKGDLSLIAALSQYQIKDGQDKGGFAIEGAKADRPLSLAAIMALCAHDIYLKKLPTFYSVTKMAEYTLGIVASVIILSLIAAVIIMVFGVKRKKFSNKSSEDNEIELKEITLQKAVFNALQDSNENAKKE